MFILVLFISSIIVPLAKNLQLSAQEAVAINDTQAAAYVVSATTSMLATLLIAYRIYSVFKQNTIFTMRRRFGQVIDILVQSAAIYAIMMLIQATSLFLPNLGTSPSVFALDNYAVTLMFPIAVCINYTLVHSTQSSIGNCAICDGCSSLFLCSSGTHRQISRSHSNRAPISSTIHGL